MLKYNHTRETECESDTGTHLVSLQLTELTLTNNVRKNEFRDPQVRIANQVYIKYVVGPGGRG